MLPDRADTAAVVEEAVKAAAEYWGTPYDKEQQILDTLQQRGIVITWAEFNALVEAKIAIVWADQHADLSRYDEDDDCDWVTRAEFIRQQREEWFTPTLDRVVRRTREAREATAADDLQAAA